MMWFWGSVLGMFVGASLHGWSGAFWGAVIGLLAALLLAKKGKAAETALKSGDIETRLAQTQRTLEEIQARLVRLERHTAMPPSSIAPVAGVDDASAEAISPHPAPPAKAADINEPPPLPSGGVYAKPIEPAAQPARTMAASRLQTENVIHADTASPGAKAAEQVVGVAQEAGSAKPIPTAPRATPVSMTAAVPEPSGPGLVERMLEGNLVAKLGVVILFFGVGFLLKFAYDRGLFPPELRLFVVAAAGFVMFFIGYRLMESRRNYALVMMGGAMGLLYLDVFFALKTFGLIGAPVGFVLFAALGIATIFLAVRMDARVFAALGLTGAFLAPILASTGSGNHVLLFSYYLLLNLVILGASWFKSWRELNFIGFLFTFAIAIFWGRSTYQPAHFSTVEPFLIAFFLLYLAIPILFAHRQPPELKGLVDGTLVFGMPMSAAMLQAALTRGMGDQILAWSAMGAAMVYGGLAWALWRREKMRLLAEAHLALAVVFGTVAPYFAFQGYPTFAFWTLEGAAIFWMGCRQSSVLARAFAIFLQVGAAGYFWWVTRGIVIEQPWTNDRVIGCGLIAAASLITAWFMHRFNEVITATESSMQGGIIGWGGLWLLFGVAIGTWHEWAADDMRLSVLLLAMAFTFTLFEWLGAWLGWSQIRLAARAHVVLIAVISLLWIVLLPGSHPLRGHGAWVWPLTFIAYFYVLHRQRRDGLESDRGWRYTAAWLLMIFLATWEALWRYDARQFGWVFAIGAAGLAASALRFRLRESVPAAEDSPPLRFSSLPMWWSLVWWFAGLHGAIELHAAAAHHLALHLGAAAVSVLLFEVAGQVLGWTLLRRTQWLLTAAMLLGALHLAGHGVNPFRDAQFPAWAVAFAVGAWVLHRQERETLAVSASAQHLLLFGMLLWLTGYELVWRAEQAGLSLSWQYAGAGITIASGLALATWGMVHARWPFTMHAVAFRGGVVMPLLIFGLIWTLIANAICDGGAWPLPFVPLLNPFDVAQLAIFATGIWALGRAMGDGPQAKDTVRILQLMFAAAGFYWVNAALLRTVHHWAGVPFELQALLDSRIAQAALSLLWTSTALVMMLAAGRRQSRPLWMLGAGLLGVVVLKLFVNDIGTSGTERVVSFIGVGVLLMVIGYVAPVPPKAGVATTDAPVQGGDGQGNNIS